MGHSRHYPARRHAVASYDPKEGSIPHGSKLYSSPLRRQLISACGFRSPRLVDSEQTGNWAYHDYE